MLFLLVAATQACQIFGVRLSLGPLYNPRPQGTYAFLIAFNTRTQCSPVVLLQNQTLSCNSEQILIDPSQYNVSYSFSTFVHSCPVARLGAIVNQSYSFSYLVGQRRFRGAVPSFDQSLQNFLIMGDWSRLKTHKDYDDVVPCLSSRLQSYSFTAVIFMGDLGYDLQSENCTFYQDMLSYMQFLTSRLPFMTTTGNHESYPKTKISAVLYNRTFLMPLNTVYRNSFYSFTVGRTHFVAFDPVRSFYGITPDDAPLLLSLMAQDFKNQTAGIDWFIPFAHYPYYCSVKEPYCDSARHSLAAFIDFFNSRGAQLVLSGHAHLYEREWPISSGGMPMVPKIDNVSEGGQNVPLYHYNGYPMYVIQGDAGNDKSMHLQNYSFSNLTVANGQNSGFAVLTIYNSTLLKYERVKAGSQEGQSCFPSDRVFLQRDRAGVRVRIWPWLGLGLGLLGVGWRLWARRTGM